MKRCHICFENNQYSPGRREFSLCDIAVVSDHKTRYRNVHMRISGAVAAIGEEYFPCPLIVIATRKGRYGLSFARDRYYSIRGFSLKQVSAKGRYWPLNC